MYAIIELVFPPMVSQAVEDVILKGVTESLNQVVQAGILCDMKVIKTEVCILEEDISTIDAKTFSCLKEGTDNSGSDQITVLTPNQSSMFLLV